MKLNYLVGIFLSLVQISLSWRLDISYDNEEAYCKLESHLTLKPNVTCCNNQVIIPGLGENFDESWSTCKNQVVENTIEGIGWAMYECILKKANGGKDKISLQEFSDIMTKNYPETYKSKINEEVAKQSVKDAPLSNRIKLEKIRVTYYDIETAVCENPTGPLSAEMQYGQIEKCNEWKEEAHRASMCCEQSYPVDIKYGSLFDLGDRVQNEEECRSKFHPTFDVLNFTEALENTIVEMCDIACAMDKMKNGFTFESGIINNLNYWEFNVSNEVTSKGEILLPKYFGSDLREKAFNYAISTFILNDTIDSIMNYTFADSYSLETNTLPSVYFVAYNHLINANKTNATEFSRRPFHKSFINMPIICAAYSEIVTRMEIAIFQCKVGELPSTPENPEEESGNGPESNKENPEPEPEAESGVQTTVAPEENEPETTTDAG